MNYTAVDRQHLSPCALLMTSPRCSSFILASATSHIVNFVLGDGLFSMSLARAIVVLFVGTFSFAISLAITANGLVDVVSRWE